MKLTAEFEGHTCAFDASAGVDIAIPLEFDASQPNAFSLRRASSEAVRAGDFVGSTADGGSVNCRDVHFNPHGNGTHTECVGHIVDEPVAVGEMLEDAFHPATLLTVRVRPAGRDNESYVPELDEDDRVITRAALNAAMAGLGTPPAFTSALVVRTSPNEESKKTRDYSGDNPPFLTRQAMEWVVEQEVDHLLVDVPSVDREDDAGRTTNHHTFWEVEQGANTLGGETPSHRTITEMVYLPDELSDGAYLLSIDLPRFQLDAAPSRPRLYPVE